MKNFWVSLIVFLIILKFPIAAQAQWGSEYVFSFSLTNIATRLNTLEQSAYLKSKSKVNYLIINTKTTQYIVTSESQRDITFKNGVVSISYFTFFQRSNLNIKIQRKTKNGIDSFKSKFVNNEELSRYISILFLFSKGTGISSGFASII